MLLTRNLVTARRLGSSLYSPILHLRRNNILMASSPIVSRFSSNKAADNYENMSVAELKKALHTAKLSYMDCKDKESLIERAKMIPSSNTLEAQPTATQQQTQQTQQTQQGSNDEDFQKMKEKLISAALSDPELMAMLENPKVQRVMAMMSSCEILYIYTRVLSFVLL